MKFEKMKYLRSAFVKGLLLAAVVVPLGSCGYSSKPLYRTSVKTVAVPIFENKTFRRDWEFRLTEAIAKNIEYRTPYKIAASDKADTQLTGEIVTFAENVLTRRYGENLPRETQISVAINFQWKDLRSGRIIVRRENFTRTATEIPQIGERVDDASQAVIEKLAAAIVDQMQNDEF